jgi:hypothetical protein
MPQSSTCTVQTLEVKVDTDSQGESQAATMR